jgi:prepilin-type processing-associated H-X9-DG protein
VLILIVIAIAFAMSRSGPSSGPGAKRGWCANNMGNIARALERYRVEHGRYPPAYLADKDGRPIHSWRVLILPNLCLEDIFDEYDFREPWDGPTNKRLSQYLIHLYVCPCDDDTRKSPGTTSFLAVVGPGTVWSEPPDRESRSPDREKRILLVEVARSGINWMEPKDLTLDEALRGINPPGGKGISSVHRGGANVVYTDGSTEFLPSSTTSQQLRELILGRGWAAAPAHGATDRSAGGAPGKTNASQ